MPGQIAYLGVPTSLGSYSPGQEKAPQAFRSVGFPQMLRERGVRVVDHGDLVLRRWRPDRTNRFAQHLDSVIGCVKEIAATLSKSVDVGLIPVVIGGNCTIELGVVAASVSKHHSLGLIYLDLHADMNTPTSTTDGSLDWMGMAHMVGLNGAVRELAACGPRYPLLSPEQVYLLGFDPASATEWECSAIRDQAVMVATLAEVLESPVRSATRALEQWATKVDRFLVHFDVDLVDFDELPLAENYSKNKGLSYGNAMEILEVLFQSQKFAGLTVTEINPDHGAEDGSTIQKLAQDLSRLIGRASNIRM